MTTLSRRTADLIRILAEERTYGPGSIRPPLMERVMAARSGRTDLRLEAEVARLTNEFQVTRVAAEDDETAFRSLRDREVPNWSDRLLSIPPRGIVADRLRRHAGVTWRHLEDVLGESP